MKTLKIILAVCIVFTTITSQSIAAQEVAVQPETPSMWAAWDIQMLNAYGMGDTTTYTGYKEVVNKEGFELIHSMLAKKFEVEDELESELVDVTRGDVITEFYDVIHKALAMENEMTDETVLKYFVDEKLINGRVSGEYALDKTISNEEMLVFAKRVYDHLIYVLDQDVTGAFWQVSDGNNTVYLLGSIHATDGSVYPLNDKIMAGFMDAEALVVEANTLVANPEDAAYLQQIILLEEGVTLDQMVSEEVYTEFVETSKAQGWPEGFYTKVKPWYASLLVSSTKLNADNYKFGLGIDLYFQSLAYGSKPIMEIEGVRYQLDMFDSFTDEQQEGLLSSSLGESGETSELLSGIMTNWKSGNVSELNDLLFAEEGETELEKAINETVWGTRNKNMAEYVIELLEADTEDDYFVVVGAGHMLNDDGIIVELEAAGYVVDQVE